MDTNSSDELSIDTYSIEQLEQLLKLTDPTTEEVVSAANRLAEELKETHKYDLAQFILEAKDKIIDNMDHNSYEKHSTLLNDENNNNRNPITSLNDEDNNNRNPITSLNDEDNNNKNPITSLNDENNNNNRNPITPLNDVDNYNINQTFSNYSMHSTMDQQRVNIEQTHNVSVAQGLRNPLLRNTFKKVLILDSQFRENLYKEDGTVTPTDNYITTLTDPLRNIISMRLSSITLPYVWYTFTNSNGNTCFYIDNSAVTIPEGNYSSDELIDILEEKSEEAGLDIDFSYSKASGKIDISYNSPSGNDASMIFYSYDNSWNCLDDTTCSSSRPLRTNRNIGWNMGFRRNVDSSGVFYISLPNAQFISGDSPISTFGSKYLILSVDDYNLNTINNCNITGGHGNIAASLPSYYTRDLSFACNSSPGEQEKGYVNPSVPRKLTQSQLYSINEIISHQQQVSTRVEATPPQNMLGFIKINATSLSTGERVSITSDELEPYVRPYFGPVDIDRLHIALLSDSGGRIDLNGRDWACVLELEYLYQY